MHFIETYSFFLIPVAVGILAEIVKFFNHCRKYGWDLRASIAYGHMPSAHTAFVTSLATTIGAAKGIESATFGIAACFALVVIMDALRLRVYMGEHAAYINKLITSLKLDEAEFPRLKERVGHKPSEVIVGGIFGIAVTLFILMLFS